ncbi:MAG: glycosyltransferase family 2 protein [Patescibacteria group bacterium]
MKIYIIIIAYNGSQYIKKCLASVFLSKYSGQFNVVAVDNHSLDNTVEIIEKEFPQVELIKLEKNLGFVGGNNIGIKRALVSGAGYVVLLNQDTEVEYDWLTQLVKAAQDDKVGIVQAMLLLANERALTNNVGNAMHYLGFGFVKNYRERVDSWYHRPPFAIGYASGAAMLIKKEVLQTLTLPSPWKGEGTAYLNPVFFMYHEDLDLCWRARLAGYEIMIAPQATVYHHYEFNRNKKMFYWTERNRWAVLLQNYSLVTLLKLSPILLFIEIAMLGYSLISGWFVYKLQSYGWIIINLPGIFKTRIKTQSMRKVGDSEVMKHMDSALSFPKFINPLLKKYWQYVR